MRWGCTLHRLTDYVTARCARLGKGNGESGALGARSARVECEVTRRLYGGDCSPHSKANAFAVRQKARAWFQYEGSGAECVWVFA